MSREMLLVVESLSNTKNIEPADVFEVLEAALAVATKNHYGSKDIDVQVVMNRQTGDYETFRRWLVVADEAWDDSLSETTLPLSKAKEKKADVQVDDLVSEKIESLEFTRIAAQAVKQTMIQKINEAVRKRLVETYSALVNTLVNGIVKKVTRDYVLLDLGENVEALLTRSEMLPNEAMRVGDRVRALLYDVHYEPRGSQLFLSRTAPQMLIELFKIEVPEIGEEVIEIKSAARDPGVRAKIAVKTNDGRIDPVGACVGMRGSRVQAVSNELSGERIDIILWDDNPAQLVINAMAPAEVQSIILDEDTHTIDVAVNKDQLSQAIGRNGQNVRLASELTGWTINVMTVDEAREKSEAETQTALQLFVESLGVDEEVAAVLVEEGFSSVEEVAYVPLDEMLQIDAFDEALVEELRNRAKDYLLTQALAGGGESEPEADLLSMEGMTPDLAHDLARQGIKTMEDLAELSVDDLQEIRAMDNTLAAQLIMTARKPWFNEE